MPQTPTSQPARSPRRRLLAAVTAVAVVAVLGPSVRNVGDDRAAPAVPAVSPTRAAPVPPKGAADPAENPTAVAPFPDLRLLVAPPVYV